MKALSVRQPWTWLICAGLKDVENRTWGDGYRGPLLLHAGKTVEENDRYWLSQKYPIPEHLDTGAIIGAAVLVNVTKRASSEWHNPGFVGWYLDSPILFKTPVPWRGRLGLFDVPDDAVPELAGWMLQLQAQL
jgi:hypothetical protein